MINTEKRKRVMQRSIRLGHCICDHRIPCPCDVFKEKNICSCAGERPEAPTGEVKLTQLVEKAGCASKIDQAFLKQVLRNLPAVDDPRVLVGVPAGDDAGVYDMGDGKALVQTVDVFTPSVDDPYTFGQVAAANSVSDIYAMGGTPMTAVSVLGFPVRKIPDEAMSRILSGGIDKMNEAGVAIIGGHSINQTARHRNRRLRRTNRQGKRRKRTGNSRLDDRAEQKGLTAHGRVWRSCLHRRDGL
jgi:hypothetical protein